MFCRHCGKEIPEGEVCFCEGAVNQRTAEQNPAPAAPAQDPAAASPVAAPAAPAVNVDINNIVQSAVNAIVGIPGSLKQVFHAPASRLSTSSSIVMAIICMLLHMFAGMCFYGNLTEILVDVINEISSGMATIPSGFKIKGLVGLGAWCGILTYVLTTLYTWIIGLVYRAINKEEKAALAAFQSAISVGVYPAMAFLLAGLCFLLSAGLGMVVLLFTIFLGVAALSNMQNILRKKAVTAGALMISGLLIAIIVAVVAYVDVSILIDFVVDYAQQQANNAIGGMGNLFG